MKVKNITKEEKTFEPITIEIIIESEDELKDLHHRLNVSRKDVVVLGLDSRIDLMSPGCSGAMELWTILNDLCVERGLY